MTEDKLYAQAVLNDMIANSTDVVTVSATLEAYIAEKRLEMIEAMFEGCKLVADINTATKSDMINAYKTAFNTELGNVLNIL